MRAARFLVVAVLAACGARSSIDLESYASPALAGDAAVDAPGSTAPDAAAKLACHEQPWVVFSLGIPTPPNHDLPSNRVYARHPDGTGGHVLGLPRTGVAFPSVSPDGKSLLYETSAGLFLYRFGATSDRLVAREGATSFASLSPDGARVVYSDGTYLWLDRAAGGGTPRLLVNGDNAIPAGYPMFTADSQTVLFGAQASLHSIGVDGTGLRTLLQDPTGNGFPTPALSTDSKSVATIVECQGHVFTLRTYPLASLPASCDAGSVIAQVPQAAIDNGLAWGPTGIFAFSDAQDVVLVSAVGARSVLTGDLTSGREVAFGATWAPGCAEL